ncbi:MAG: nucleotidyl transferase AbiEii/AbiGii toxin family protein [Deltaproteobacteria bacterium]|nr:nucleotidyl transferase AbiEii/AbiGii toxin family protein [Deltaproteobacteria bacterium]
MRQQWESLFNRAVKQLEAGKLPTKSWSFGGGTALMFMFNHRHSKDIDIFLSDVALCLPQDK